MLNDPYITKYDFKQDALTKVEKIWKDITDQGFSPSKYPTMYLIGGQPGAGKSRALEKAKIPDGYNVLKIVGDDFRRECALYDYLNKTYGKDSSKYTGEFAGAMVYLLKERAIKYRLNYSIEGTFRTATAPLNELKVAKESGYDSCVIICTCPKEVSWASTIERAQKMEQRGMFPRYVPKEHHDYVVEHLAENVKTVFDSGLVDHLEIMSREKVLYNSAEHFGYDSQRIIEVINGELNRNVNLQHGTENSHNLGIPRIKGKNR